MRRSIFLTTASLAICLFSACMRTSTQTVQLSKTEKREIEIDSIFTKAESDKLDTKGMLRYEYAFSNSIQDPLEKLSKRLVRDSFEVISIHQVNDHMWRLLLMKNDILSRESMKRLDRRLRSLAYEYIIDRYEGFTITPLQVNPLHVPDDQFMGYLGSLANEPLFEAARYLLTHQSYNRSMIAFRESIERQFKEDTAHYEFGNALIATNELVHAIEHWEAARNMNHRYLEAYLKLGDIFFENSHFNRSLYNYQEADTIKHNDDVILYKIASNLYQLRRYNESWDYAQRAHKINRKNVFVNGLIRILRDPAIKKLRKKYPER